MQSIKSFEYSKYATTYYNLTTSLCAFSFLFSVFMVKKNETCSWKWSTFILLKHKMWLICNGRNNGWKYSHRVKTNQEFLKFSVFLQKEFLQILPSVNTLAAEAPSKVLCVIIFQFIQYSHEMAEIYLSTYVCTYVCETLFVFISKYVL